MNFSEVFKLSSQLCKFSPDGKLLASGVQYRLVVRDVNTLQILQLYTCLDQIQHIEWSSDSLFILCAMYKRGIVQVWSLEQPNWHCKIDEGSAGLVASCWSPDGRHILNTTEFHDKQCCWDLQDPSSTRWGDMLAHSLDKHFCYICIGTVDFSGNSFTRKMQGPSEITEISWGRADDTDSSEDTSHVKTSVDYGQPEAANRPDCESRSGPCVQNLCLISSIQRPVSRAFLKLDSAEVTVVDFKGLKEVNKLKAATSERMKCTLRITFTKDGRYMALAERRDCKDYISLFVCSDWQLLRHFDTETQDMAGIEWAPNGCVLAVWDTCLEYKVLLYSLDGRLLSMYRAYEWSLGVKSIAWSPSSQFLAIGSYDEKVRILNHVTWKKIADLDHPVTVASPKIIVYREVEKSPAVEMDKLVFPPSKAMASSLFSTKSKYEIAQESVSLHHVKPAIDRANPRVGVGMLAFSSDNCFLATRNDNIPNALWIWDIQKMKLFVVLEQLCAVQLFQWDPCQSRLAICTANTRVYLWSPAGCVSVQVPMEGDFQMVSLCWHPSGDSLALLSKDSFCVCYLDRDEEEVK